MKKGVGARKRGPLPGETLSRRAVAVLAGAGVSLAAFFLYLGTLAPTVLPYELPELADATMLQMQVCTLGITHPTGYPSYVMLSHLLTYLPFGDCAYRANLASAVWAALAVLAIYAAASLLTRRVFAAATGALAFGLGGVFWSQAVIAEVYTINALFVALALVALLLWRERRRDGLLLLSAFSIGLAMTNHMTSALLLPGALLFVGLVDRRKLVAWRLVLKGAGACLIGLLPYLYLPIRSPSAPMNANNPDNLQRFWYVVSGGDLRGGFFAFDPAELPGRASLYAEYLFADFNWLLLAAGAAGFTAMLLRDRAGAALTAFLFLGWAFHAVQNDIVDVELYFIPTYVILAVWISTGLGTLLDEAETFLARLPETFPRTAKATSLAVLSAALLLLPLPGLRETYAQNDRSEDYRAVEIADAVAENAAPDSTVLHLRSNLWYMVLVEGRRRDLTLVDPFQGYASGRQNDVVWPGDLDPETRKRRYGLEDITGVAAARAVAEDGPVYVLAHAGLSGQPFYDAGFRTIRIEGPLYELIPPKELSSRDKSAGGGE